MTGREEEFERLFMIEDGGPGQGGVPPHGGVWIPHVHALYEPSDDE